VTLLLSLLAFNPDPGIGPHDVTVRWDSWGVPHVDAQDHGSLGYYEGSDATLLPQPELPPVVNDDSTLTTQGYPINYGNSYVLTVAFEEEGPVARALLTYSQSEDPESPHFDDQTVRYGSGEGLRLVVVTP